MEWPSAQNARPDTVAVARTRAGRGLTWPRLPEQSRQTERSESLTTLARKVIGTNSVRRWRFEQLHEAGYSIGDSLVLSARTDVDLHQATRLLREGCPAATAVRILI